VQLSKKDLLEQVHAIAEGAGALVMEVYRSDFSARSKDDASPVTEADEVAEAFIVAALHKLTPEIPVVAEEAVAAGRIPEVANLFWLVDPLDGTKEFIGRNDEFTVNIALIEAGAPVLGVVLAPALGRLYAGIAGGDAYVEDETGRRMIRCRAVPDDGLTVVASRSHGDMAALTAYLGSRKVASIRGAGSSLKLCVLAAGEADLYPRLGRTMEWDIAAGHAVLSAAGGTVSDLSGAPLTYGKPGFENPHFVSRGLAD
jgi:3'(2'), 5'-bisphosphate nucleotidase